MAPAEKADPDVRWRGGGATDLAESEPGRSRFAGLSFKGLMLAARANLIRRPPPVRYGFALAMLVWFMLPLATTPTKAAGCHVAERPALGFGQAERGDSRIPAWGMQNRVEFAPPVLTRLPCPADTPHSPPIATVAIGAACLMKIATIPPLHSGPFRAIDTMGFLDPHPFRVDRPPR